MKKILTPLIILILLFSVSALAKNSDSAGSGKVSGEQKEARKEMNATKEKINDSLDEEKEKTGGGLNTEREKNKKAGAEEAPDNPNDDLKGLEKQREKKTEQIQKELDKGSEQGQESRQNRKKWWKFWGE